MYQWDPEEYASNSDTQKNLAERLMQRLTLTRTDKILDVGSGDGKITFELAEKVPQGYVVGVDLSDDMVRFASSHIFTKKHQNISFIHADASILPFNNVFDIIFSNSVLHWILDHQRLLSGFSEVLRSKGRLFI